MPSYELLKILLKAEDFDSSIAFSCSEGVVLMSCLATLITFMSLSFDFCGDSLAFLHLLLFSQIWAMWLFKFTHFLNIVSC